MLAGIVLAGRLSAQNAWTRVPGAGPSPRGFSACAYDMRNGQVVLFGGSSGVGSPLGDTWTYDDKGWQQRNPVTSPPARIAAAMAYDSERGRTVLFGGNAAAGTPLSDTWEWDGTAWMQVTIATPPAARAFHSMAFDGVSAKVILFGGESQLPKQYFGDTWVYDGSSWTELAVSGPAGRARHSMANDFVRDRIVLFGGRLGLSTLGDTWEWDGSQWAQRASQGPTPRAHAALAYSAPHRQCLLVGGSTDGSTWGWDGSSWSIVLPASSSPPPSQVAAIAYRSARLSVTLFGGFSSTNIALGDTWQFAYRRDYQGEGAGLIRPIPDQDPSLGPRALGVAEVLSLHVVLPVGAPDGRQYVVAAVKRTQANDVDLLSGTYEGATKTFVPDQAVTALNTPGAEKSPTISADLLTLIYDGPNGVALCVRRTSASVAFSPSAATPLLYAPTGEIEPRLCKRDGRPHLLFVDSDIGGIWLANYVDGRLFNHRLVVEDLEPVGVVHAPSAITDASDNVVSVVYTRRAPGAAGDVWFNSGLDAEANSQSFRLLSNRNDSGSGSSIGGLIRYTQLPPSSSLDPLLIRVLGMGAVPLEAGNRVDLTVFGPPTDGAASPMVALILVGTLGASGLPIPGLGGSPFSLDPMAPLVTLPARFLDRTRGSFTQTLTVPALPPDIRLYAMAAAIDLTTGLAYLGNTAPMFKDKQPCCDYAIRSCCPKKDPPQSPVCRDRDISQEEDKAFGQCPDNYTRHYMLRGCKGKKNKQYRRYICYRCPQNECTTGSCKVYFLRTTSPGGCIWEWAVCRCQ